jgi:hypothetical protein
VIVGGSTINEDADGTASMAVQPPDQLCGASKGIVPPSVPGHGALLACMVSVIRQLLPVGAHWHGGQSTVVGGVSA